jgi:hypothetical protein
MFTEETKSNYRSLQNQLLGVMRQHSRSLLLYGLALFVTITILNTIPATNVVGNGFNEPIWLYHTLCVDGFFDPQYKDVCRGINIQSLDHSAGAKYFLRVARELAGISADIPKYYYHVGLETFVAISNFVRTPFMNVMTWLALLPIMLFFYLLQRSFGYPTAFISLLLLLLTPYWHFILRGISAEPVTLLFGLLVWLTLFWLVRLLDSSPAPRLRRICLAAGLTGLLLGYSVGIKPNGAIFGVAVGVVLLVLFIKNWRNWLVFVYVATIMFLTSLVALFVTNPLFWDVNVLERLHIYLIFRGLVLYSFFGGNLASRQDAFTSAVGSAYDAPTFALLPWWLSVIFSLIGLWYGWRIASRQASVSMLYLLISGLLTALLLPVTVSLGFNYYQYITTLTVLVLCALGIAYFVTLFLRFLQLRAGKLSDLSAVFRPAAAGQAFWLLQPGNAPIYRFSRPQIFIGGALTLLTLLLLLGGGWVYLKSSQETKLWQAYVRAPTEAEKLEYLVQIVELNPQARVLITHNEFVARNAGEPLIEELADYFARNVSSSHPQMLTSLKRIAPLLRTRYTNPEILPLLDYNLAQFEASVSLRSQYRMVYTNTTPSALLSEQIAPDETLISAQHPIVALFNVQQVGNYRLLVNAINTVPAPSVIGVRLDGQNIGTLTYAAGNILTTGEYITVNLREGQHALELYLVNAGKIDYRDRIARIKEITLESTANDWLCASAAIVEQIRAQTCSTPAQIVQLNNSVQRLELDFEVEVNALHTLRLGLGGDLLNRQFRVSLDGKPFTVASTPPRSNWTEGWNVTGELRLPPVYLAKGRHQLLIELLDAQNRAPLEFTGVKVLPQVPTVRMFSPLQMGAPPASPFWHEFSGGQSLTLG